MTAIPAPQGGPTAKLDGATYLAKTAELGEYFGLAVQDGEPCRSLSLLLDDAAVTEFVGRTREAIATSARCDRSDIPVKVAASSFQLGIAARLLSPVVGAATCLGVLPLLDLRSVTWRSTTGHVPQFGATDLQWVAAPTPQRAAALISASVLTAIFAPLNETLRSLTSLSPRVTWGNVISAANGAVTVLSMSQPRHEASGRALIGALLETEHLNGTATLARGVFLRSNCCLFYQAPGSGLCGDCVLSESDPPGRRARP
ncbi:MAG: (2Fe-2S)-binding protein [Mycobacterium sp.]